jgi:outer membrane protein insertion porin family
VYRRDVDATSLDGVGEYESSTMGLGVRAGLPISEKDTVFFGAGVEQLDITTTDSSPLQYKQFVAEHGNSNNTLRLDSSIARDTRDSFLFPTKGMLQRAAIEFGAPPGDIQYYKLSLQHQQYLPLSKDFTLMLNGEIGYGGGIGTSDLPFYRNFFVGGVSSVRGFESGTIGPKELDTVTNEVVTLGGDTKLVGNIELLFPLPGMKDNSLRLSTFLDAGAAFGEGNPLYGSNTLSLDELRFSTGLGVAWNSPLGPLRFSLAYPLNKKDTDKTQVFQFNLGSTF